MNKYDYSLLNDKEFEELCRDLISKDLNFPFQSFKSGKDGGIDLRYSTSNQDNAIIIQAKQYSKSGFSALKRDLKKELPKVQILSPQRYILSTSVEFSPQQAVEIKNIFGGYIHNLQDIYHKSVLDCILSDNESIERKYYKLWLSSSNVLKTIVHNGSYGMSLLLEVDIKNNIKKYVESKNHSIAYDKLLKDKIIVITGKPGVGKTTLAKILAYKLMSEKNCQLIEINDSINEANNLIDYNGDDAQVIFFDDFLGAILYEIVNPKNSEGLINKFIQRIKSIPGKYLVITSRTTIVNKAISRFEAFNTVQYADNNRFVIEIEDYSREEKAKILYNHLFFGVDNPKILEFVKQENFYLNIIDHKNYNPRLIEFITGPQYSEIKNKDEYKKKVLENLEYPETIWKVPYEYQLDQYERWVLQILITVKNEGSYDLIENLFNERLNFENQSGLAVSSESTFRKCIKNLSGSYLNLKRNSNIDSTALSFSNPSIADFLRDYISNDFSILRRMILSSLTINQLNNIYEVFGESYLKNYNSLIPEFKNYFASNESLLSNNYSNEGVVDLAFTYYKYFPAEDHEKIMGRLLSEEVLVFGEHSNFSRLLFVLSSIKKVSSLKNLIINFWDQIIFSLYDIADDEYDYSHIVDLFLDFEEDFEEWISIDFNAQMVWSSMSEFVSEYVRDQLLDDVLSYDFEQIEINHFPTENGYWADYIYELQTDIPSLAEELLNDLLATMELYGYFTMEDLSISIDNVKDTIIEKYTKNMESAPYERDSDNRAWGNNRISHNTDDSIQNLFS